MEGFLFPDYLCFRLTSIHNCFLSHQTSLRCRNYVVFGKSNILRINLVEFMKFKLEKKNTATFDAEEGARAQLD